MDLLNFKKKIFHISSSSEFEKMAIELFNYQVAHNIFYKKYCYLLNCYPSQVSSIDQIPFMPIEFFKTERILCQNTNSNHFFLSSGTTSQKKSKHYINCLKFYEKTISLCFENFWGKINNYRFFCLTPNKKEAPNSSLVHMCDFFVRKTKNLDSGFYLKNTEKLLYEINKSKRNNQPFIIIGLSFAILDFAEKHSVDLNGGHIIETGGMKNRRKEMIREDFYKILKEKFKIQSIQSEYGMTELLSQSYSLKNGEFKSPPWKKVMIRDKQNPLKINNLSSGGINIIDLSNIHSCAFLATEDFGRISNDKFKVLGRLKNSSLRGCSTMI
tara:strand:+ start:276 stop:1256 length:981 start_codon:yes stop_codon:yes gene_type:complete